MTVIRVLCIHGFRQTALQLKGRTRALEKRLRQYVRDHSNGRYRCELVFDVEGPHALPHIVAKDGGDVVGSKPRRAWLVTKEQYNHIDDGAWVHNPNQFLMQTEGWRESLDVLDGHLDRHGPFDCILGFSQGAAVAGYLAVRESARPPVQRRFKSVIIISGYVLAMLKELKVKNVPAMLPSLHVYGGDDKDCQVPKDCSLELAGHFDESTRSLLQTDSGHLIPSSREYVAEIGHFLLQHCASISN